MAGFSFVGVTTTNQWRLLRQAATNDHVAAIGVAAMANQ